MSPLPLSDISRYRGELMGIAMILIILFHIPLARADAFFGLHRLGNVGVDMFFFLSGMGLWFAWTKGESTPGVPESMAHTVHIALAEELGAVDARAAHSAEYRQDKHQHDLVCDGGSGNSLCAEAADHDVVQQGHKGSDKLLDHDGNQQGDDAFIEGLVADKTRKHKYLNS